MVLLLLTSCIDPGIVPRNLHPPEPEDDGYASCLSSELPGNQAGPSRLPSIKYILVNGIIVKVKYCHTCMLYSPPRCSHCSICNNCVERFDHHIGKITSHCAMLGLSFKGSPYWMVPEVIMNSTGYSLAVDIYKPGMYNT
ncbi:hypothetical protein GIB67_015236 [Kingdonia uniflora]|uniref:S-acyltransferase n=1 Tax=Kingdonia uniflora TaxID=39325 RepID=A0A7J7MT20_9MAGN|nr:hypothetical protein GIB67_015236 [Kingdonia uniflora]